MQTFFEVMDVLVDTNKQLLNGKITVEQAKQIATTTQVYINGAKVMLEAMKLAGVNESSFFFLKDAVAVNNELIREDEIEYSIASVEPKDRVQGKLLSARMIKGMFNITEEESEKFYKWLNRHAIFDLVELNKNIDSFDNWKKEGKR